MATKAHFNAEEWSKLVETQRLTAARLEGLCRRQDPPRPSPLPVHGRGAENAGATARCSTRSPRRRLVSRKRPPAMIRPPWCPPH